jgi:hypothetical protein
MACPFHRHGFKETATERLHFSHLLPEVLSTRHLYFYGGLCVCMLSTNNYGEGGDLWHDYIHEALKIKLEKLVQQMGAGNTMMGIPVSEK